MKETNRKNQIEVIVGVISLVATWVLFWVLIICAALRDRTIVAPWVFLAYVIASAMFWRFSVRKITWREIGYLVLMEALGTVPYIIITIVIEMVIG